MMIGNEYLRLSRAYGRGDYAGAVASCRSILVRDPEDGFAMAMLAYCHAAQDQHAEALGWADKALAKTPDFFPLLRLAASLCVELGEHARAKPLVIRSLAADPKKHAGPEWLLIPLRLLVRMPLMKRAFRADAADQIELGGGAREYQEWQAWAKGYLVWLERQGEPA